MLSALKLGKVGIIIWTHYQIHPTVPFLYKNFDFSRFVFIPVMLNMLFWNGHILWNAPGNHPRYESHLRFLLALYKWLQWKMNATKLKTLLKVELLIRFWYCYSRVRSSHMIHMICERRQNFQVNSSKSWILRNRFAIIQKIVYLVDHTV